MTSGYGLRGPATWCSLPVPFGSKTWVPNGPGIPPPRSAGSDDGRVSRQNAAGPDVTFGLFDWVDADGVREAGASLARFAEQVAPALRELASP